MTVSASESSTSASSVVTTNVLLGKDDTMELRKPRVPVDPLGSPPTACVDEPGRDQLHADRRQLEHDVLCHGGKRCRERRDEREARRCPAVAGAPLKSKVSRARTSRGVPSLARRHDGCASDITAFRLEVEVRQRRVGRPGPRPDHSTSACQRDTVKADARGSTAPTFGDRAARRPRADAMALELAGPAKCVRRKGRVGSGSGTRRLT
jgi:hypothetical protein